MKKTTITAWVEIITKVYSRTFAIITKGPLHSSRSLIAVLLPGYTNPVYP